jgi:hypothetical protein
MLDPALAALAIVAMTLTVICALTKGHAPSVKLKHGPDSLHLDISGAHPNRDTDAKHESADSG